VAAYATLSFVAVRHGATPFYWLLLAYLYFLGAGWAAYELLPFARARALWLGTVVALFWVVPAVAVHPSPSIFLTLGWDFTLAAYSYGVDTRSAQDRSLRDFLFFVLVNPVLVYRNRGRRVTDPRLDAIGSARFLLGAAVMLLTFGVVDPVSTLVSQGAMASVGSRRVAALWVLPIGVARFVREYAAQSAVASMQIGCMRLLGYRIPERYHWPMFARSPADFWRRWNTYVGAWARAYVFFPLVFAIPAQWRKRRAAIALVYALTVVFTFAAVGFLHDGFLIGAAWKWTTASTKWFLIMGGLVVAWEALARAFPKACPRPVRGLVERCLFLSVLGIAAALAP
jgi:hypothetical protein